uniref:Uncharacterized protein n=1 Tax=Parascaris equorum TaxID=6256 RepID=A0A914S1V9_PAREQ
MARTPADKSLGRSPFSRVVCNTLVHKGDCMGTTNISQLMAEMRQLVVNLQSRERATDGALAKSQLVNDKISSMKEVSLFYFLIRFYSLRDVIVFPLLH